jgi:VWFA-related protein
MSPKVPIAFAILSVSVSVAAVRQAPTFVSSRAVSVYATVINKYGRLVPNLARDDFEVFDNGKAQPLTVFENAVQPITIVIMVDRSGSFLWPNDLIASATDEFISDLLPADKARLGSFSGRIEIAPAEFTSDRDELRRTFIEERQDAGPTPLWNATAAAMDALANREGRRALLILADSKDNPDPADVKTTLATVTARAQAEEVVVYAVGLAGRIRNGGMGPLFQGRGGRGGRGGQGGPDGRGTATGAPDPWMIATPDQGLRKLAVDSGGGYFELAPTDGFASTFARIADELHHPYTLAFTAAALDGKMHTLKVNVRAADTTAQARRAYLAAPGK